MIAYGEREKRWKVLAAAACRDRAPPKLGHPSSRYRTFRRLGGPTGLLTDLLMLLREVCDERIGDVDLLILKMLGKRTTIDQDRTVMSLILDLTIPSSTPDKLTSTVLHDQRQ